MRLKLSFETDTPKFPTKYRECFISYIKNALTQYQSGQYFDKYYKGNVKKNFSFSVDFKNAKFNKDDIDIVENKIYMHFSILTMEDFIIFHNAFTYQLYKPFNLPHIINTEKPAVMTLKSIQVENETTINTNAVLFRLSEPMILRRRLDDSKFNTYAIYSDDIFNESITKIVRGQVLDSNLPLEIMNGFSCNPINCYKTVAKFKKAYMNATCGLIILTGTTELLNYLYLNGIGSKTSAGFGYLDVIMQDRNGVNN